ncbi:MAG: hypothetical protein IJY69_03535 [Clostridia bacterium]|nr:hypothetical protein [Clostridia bacterium]
MKHLGRLLAISCLLICLAFSLLSLSSCGGSGEGDGGGESGGGEESGEKTYVVRVTMCDGSPATSFVVQINRGSEQVGMKRVGTDGTASFTLTKGDYDVALIPIGTLSFYADPDQLKLRADSDGADIRLLGIPGKSAGIIVSPDGESEPKAETAYHVGDGAWRISLRANEYSYYIFTPTSRGVYEISAKDGAPLDIAYFGSPDNPMRMDSALVDGRLELEIRSFNLAHGSSTSTTYLIGVKGGNFDTGTLEIKKSDKALEISPSEVDWIHYGPDKDPESVTLSYANKAVTILDLDISGDDIELVLGSDGFYRLGETDGPVVYVRINCESKYLGAFSNVAENGQFRSYFYDEDGKFTHKESYDDAITKYAKASDAKTGLYPLDEYLKEVIVKCGEFRGWWNPESESYRFDGIEYNENNAWMFALCTVESESIGAEADAPCQLVEEGKLLLSEGETVYAGCYLSEGASVTFTSLPEGAEVTAEGADCTVNNGKATVTATAAGNMVIRITLGGDGEETYEISFAL